MANLFSYLIGSYRVKSEFSLPAIEATFDEPDVTIVRGEVPRSLSHTVVSEEWWEIDEEGTALVHWTPANSMLIRGGSEIVLSGPFLDEKGFSFLMGPGFSVIFLQRSIFTLHASSVKIGDSSVLFIGNKEMGKSTMTGFLNLRGYPCLGDDLCVIFNEQGKEQVYPTFPSIKLRTEAAQYLQSPTNGIVPPKNDYERSIVHHDHDLHPGAYPLKAIYALVDPVSLNPDEIVFERVKAQVSVGHIYRNIYTRHLLKFMESTALIFNRCTALSQSIPLFLCPRTHRIEDKEKQVSSLIRHWESEF